ETKNAKNKKFIQEDSRPMIQRAKERKNTSTKSPLKKITSQHVYL
ncbi:5926_t:CDS:1, partial [Racocetra persica]